jgi:hypothetical protein
VHHRERACEEFKAILVRDRELAADYRRRAALAPPDQVTGTGHVVRVRANRLEAAASADRRAEEWERIVIGLGGPYPRR